MGWSGAPRELGAGARAVCNWDEDALTLAVEAARECVSPVPASLSLASTTLPFADRDCATFVAEALDLPSNTSTLTVTGSLRCGTSALRQAANSVATHPALVVASDARRARPGSAQELSFGHGAAAVRLSGAAEPSIATLVGQGSRNADFVDHYRAEGADYDYVLEERWVREEGWLKLVPACIAEALANSGIEAREVRHLIAAAPPGVARRLAAMTGIAEGSPVDPLSHDCGDAGAAQPLLMLCAALERASPGEIIVQVGFGQGVDVLVWRVEGACARWKHRPLAAALARRAEERSYTRYLSHGGALEVDFGMRAERDNRSAQSAAWRRHRDVNAFVGGRCLKCRTVQFPRMRGCVNPQCRALDSLEAYRLANSSGRVKSFTEDWQAYSPRPPNIYGNVAFEEGGNLLMDFTDLEAGELTVGDAVRFVLRLKDVDRLRGYRRYFWKAVRS